MLVKICGITNRDDVRTVIDAGADFFGMIFVPGSRRYITVDRAKTITEAAGGSITPVGVFRNAEVGDVIATAKTLALPVVQLHGDETPDDTDRLCDSVPGCRILKAFGFENRQSLERILTWYDKLTRRDRLLAVLLDGPWGGGTGKALDWSELVRLIDENPFQTFREKIFLAGGLNSQNVTQAIKMLHPLGVDVASGVEATPGIKDAEAVKTFVKRAKSNPAR